MDAISYSITSVLGHVREVRYWYPDGSLSCPFCAAGVIAPALRCENWKIRHASRFTEGPV